MHEKILIVDDEPSVLQGYQRLFRNEFRIDTAVGARGALIQITANGPYAVVVSDLQMPGMDGAQFLSKVKDMAPDTIRILLTGQAGIETALHAVNEGSIFRFLTKPCDKETLARALDAALTQFRLVTTEKDLLGKTLRACVQVFAEVLSLVNPAAFSRAMRLSRYVSHIAAARGLSQPWRFEMAAMMSQLGCVTLDPEIIHAVYTGQPLPPDEQARYNAHPAVARDLLAGIPRMEPIAWMIAHQNQPAPVETDITDSEMADMRQGAELLRLALFYDDLLRKGVSRVEAAHRLARHWGGLDSKILHALLELNLETAQAEVQDCSLDELAPGMVLEQDIYTPDGLLLAAKGQQISFPLILKLRNFNDKAAVQTALRVTLPKGPTPVCTPSAPGKA